MRNSFYTNKAFIQAVKKQLLPKVSKEDTQYAWQRSLTWLAVLCLTLLLSGAAEQLKAQTTTSNLATQATASASTTDPNGVDDWSNINNGVISACGSGQECFIWGDPGQNNMSMQWEWSKQVRTDEMVFHHEQGDRTLTGFTLQSWDGSQWVDEKQFSSITSSPGVCSTRITFQRIRTDKIRLTDFKMTDPGQQSNPNFREIEIIKAPPATNPTASFFIPDTIYSNQRQCITNESQRDTGNVWYVDGQRQTTDDVLKYTPGSANTTQTIALAVSNGVGTDSISKQIYVAQPSAPTANFTASANIIDPQDGVEFTDRSTGGPDNWQWDFEGPRFNSVFIDPSASTSSSCFGGVNSDTSQNPVVQFLFPGRYDARLIASNSIGVDTLDRPDYIIVRDEIRDICAEGSSTSDYGRIYDDGGPDNEYSNNTNCQFTINTCRRVILELREFDLEPGDYLRVYDGKSSNGVPLWDTAKFGMDGLTGGRANVPSQITAQSGKVYLEFVTDNSGTGDGFNLTWLTQPKQFATPTAQISGPDTVCPGEPVSFTSSGQNYWAEYSWDTTGLNSTGDAGSGEELAISFPYSGTWEVDLTAANCGDTVTRTKQVRVERPSGAPSAAFSADNRSPVVGQPVSFVDSASLCASYYEWQFDGPVTFEQGTRNSAMPEVSFRQSGCYEVTLSVGNSADTATVTRQCYIDVRCVPGVLNLNSDIGIGRFQLAGGIDNRSSVGEEGFTSYFQEVATGAELGGTYQLQVSRSTSFNDQLVKVWLDVDGDNNFDEASELLARQDNVGQQYSTMVTIPDTTELGAVRLRVGAGLSGSSLRPCGVAAYGEYEDYRLEVTPDQTAPEIVLQGADTVSLPACTQLNVVDTGTYAVDNIGGRLSQVQKTVLVDPGTAGLDSIRYTATDSSGNTGVRYRYVRVGRDKIAPQASLQGADTVTTAVLEPYSDPGLASQQDTCSGLADVSTDDQVNTSELGTYPYTYIVSDSAGNATRVTRTVVVRDTTAPTFTLQGDDPLTVTLNGTYSEPGIAQLSDNYWESSAITLDIDNRVLTGGVDTFTVTYTATDGSGNTTVKERTVIIEDRTAPSVSLPQGLSAGDTVQVQAGVEADIAGRVSVSDNSRSGVTLETSGSYFSILDDQGRPTALGVYEGEWTFRDDGNNTATLELAVEVIDTRAPQLSLKGQRTTNIERWERSRYEAFDTAVAVSDNHVIAEKVVDTQASYFSEYVADSFTTGYFELRYVARDSAGNSSSIKRFVRVKSAITGLADDEEQLADIQLYPNPTAGQLTVSLDGVIEEGGMQVLNSRGQVIRQVSSDQQRLSGSYQVDLSGEPAGMYFLQITTPQSTTNQQFIIAE